MSPSAFSLSVPTVVVAAAGGADVAGADDDRSLDVDRQAAAARELGDHLRAEARIVVEPALVADHECAGHWFWIELMRRAARPLQIHQRHTGRDKSAG